jgi:hypothetical protein
MHTFIATAEAKRVGSAISRSGCPVGWATCCSIGGVGWAGAHVCRSGGGRGGAGLARWPGPDNK